MKNMVPDFDCRTIWHRKFGTKIIKGTIWHQQNKSGQFGTKIIKVDNLDCKTFITQTFTTPDVHHPQCKIRRSPPQTFTTTTTTTTATTTATNTITTADTTANTHSEHPQRTL